MYIKTTDSNKKNNVSWSRREEQGDPFGCDSTQFVHLTAFIFIIFTFASRSTDNYDNNKDTLCPTTTTTTTPVVMAMSRTGLHWTAEPSRAEHTLQHRHRTRD